jgi:hypothetical protein
MNVQAVARSQEVAAVASRRLPADHDCVFRPGRGFGIDSYRSSAVVRSTPPANERIFVHLYASPSYGYGFSMSSWLRASVNSDKKVVRYEWDYGDGWRDLHGRDTEWHTFQARSWGLPYDHTETYWVRVRAYTEDGDWNEATQPVTLQVPGTRRPRPR